LVPLALSNEYLARQDPGHAHYGDPVTFHLTFVTSTTRDATSSDITVYNSLVQAAADGAESVVRGHGWTWYAIVATQTTTPNESFTITGPVYRVDGLVVSTTSTNFYLSGAGHTNPIN